MTALSAAPLLYLPAWFRPAFGEHHIAEGRSYVGTFVREMREAAEKSGEDRNEDSKVHEAPGPRRRT